MVKIQCRCSVQVWPTISGVSFCMLDSQLFLLNLCLIVDNTDTHYFNNKIKCRSTLRANALNFQLNNKGYPVILDQTKVMNGTCVNLTWHSVITRAVPNNKIKTWRRMNLPNLASSRRFASSGFAFRSFQILWNTLKIAAWNSIAGVPQSTAILWNILIMLWFVDLLLFS